MCDKTHRGYVTQNAALHRFGLSDKKMSCTIGSYYSFRWSLTCLFEASMYKLKPPLDDQRSADDSIPNFELDVFVDQNQWLGLFLAS